MSALAANRLKRHSVRKVEVELAPEVAAQVRGDRRRAVRVAGVTVGVVGAEVEAVGAVGDYRQFGVRHSAFSVVKMLNNPQP